MDISGHRAALIVVVLLVTGCTSSGRISQASSSGATSAVASSSASTSTPDDRVLYRSSEGNFTARFEHEPIEKTSTHPKAGFKIVVRQAIDTVGGALVNSQKFSPAPPPGTAQYVLQGSMDGLPTTFKRVSRSVATTTGGLSALMGHYRGPDGGMYTAEAIAGGGPWFYVIFAPDGPKFDALQRSFITSSSSAAPENAATILKSPAPRDLVGEAVAKTMASSADVVIVNTLREETTSNAIEMRGAYDFDSNRGTLTVTLPGAVGGNREIHEIFAAGAIYVRSFSEVETGIPADKWGVLPNNKAESHYALRTPANVPFPLLLQAAELDRTVKVAAEAAGGPQVTHYSGHMTKESFIRYAGADLRAKADQFFQIGEILGDIWVDPAGRINRVVLELRFHGEASVIGGKTELNLTNFGKKVTADAPTPDQTVPLSALTGVLIG